MAQKTINARAKNKRDTSANWTANDPVLLDGEIIIVDTADGEVREKIGDGIKTYTQLPFSDERLRNLLNDKLDKTATAADSTKLNGQESSYYAADSGVVHNAGDETINGNKTFSGIVTASEFDGNLDWSNIQNAPAIPDLNNVVVYDETDTIEAADAIDADTLGGNSPSYYATKSSVDSVNTSIGTINSNIGSLDSAMSTANSDIDALESSVGTLSTSVSEVQSGKLDKSGGTMSGALVAQNNTDYEIKQVRNIFISTADPTDSDGANGDIWLKYESSGREHSG